MRESFYKTRTVEVAEFYDQWYNLEFSKRTSRLMNLFNAHERKKNNDQAAYHNCIGCNLKEGALYIRNFLDDHRNYGSLKQYLTIYTLLLYTEAERVVFIHSEIYSSGNSWNAFPNLTKLKRWANFFKHPKSYLLLHHPGYHLISDPERPNMMIDGIIDNDFVQQYYKGTNFNEELKDILSNRKRFKVFFPDILELTKEVCKEIIDFIDDILESPEHIDTLSKYTARSFE